MTNRRAGAACACLVLLTSLASCTSPEGIAALADGAGKALNEGPALFKDIHESCVRRHEDAQPITAIFLPPVIVRASEAKSEIAACAPFAAEADGLAKASGVLTAYFKAMQELAAFATSSVSGPNEEAAENAATAANLSLTQIDSIGKLSGLVTQLFTERYQRSHLVKYLREADPSVASITRGFEDIVSKDYAGLLQEEQQTLTAQYQDVGDVRDTAILLLLNRAYSEDGDDLNRRKAVASAYVAALQQIREGHHKLAQNADRLNGKSMTVALQPYITQLQALIPTLQKGF